jgi:phosphonate degradation associated HDIG domain protein
VKPVDEIAELFSSEGARAYLGERVSQAQHMCQAGALAAAAGASDSLVAAALLHDIGHFCSHVSGEDLMRGVDNRHEETGARVLERWFSSSVSEPVRLHVAAKRYLCHAEPVYLSMLSRASLYTFALQGGPMSAEEARAFERERFWADAVAVRRFDEQAKDPDGATPPFEHFASLLEQLVARRL